MNFNPENYEIIDAHIHPPTAVAQSNITPFGKDNDECSTVAVLRNAGISKACGSVIRNMDNYANITFDDIHQLNMAGLAMRDNFPDFYIPGITIHPKFPEKSCRELEVMAKQHNIRLIGELVSYLMGYGRYAIAELDGVWDLAVELDVAVSIHINSLEDTAALLKRFPQLKLIVAHPSASQDEYRQRLELIRDYPNTALDISGSGPNTWGMLRFGINTAGVDKIIFGTDFPLRNPGMYVAGVYAENLTDTEKKAIFSGNIRRLLNM